MSQTHGALSGVWSAGRLPSHSPSCVSVSETSPKIFPLTLGSSEPAGYVVIACLVRDFFPSEPLTVTWSPSREGVIVRNFPPAQAGGLYTMSSQLTLPVEQCPADQILKCQVQHLSKSSQSVNVPCKG